MLWSIGLVRALLVHFMARVPLEWSLLILFVGWPLGGTLVSRLPAQSAIATPLTPWRAIHGRSEISVLA